MCCVEVVKGYYIEGLDVFMHAYQCIGIIGVKVVELAIIGRLPYRSDSVFEFVMVERGSGSSA